MFDKIYRLYFVNPVNLCSGLPSEIYSSTLKRFSFFTKTWVAYPSMPILYYKFGAFVASYVDCSMKLASVIRTGLKSAGASSFGEVGK